MYIYCPEWQGIAVSIPNAIVKKKAFSEKILVEMSLPENEKNKNTYTHRCAEKEKKKKKVSADKNDRTHALHVGPQQRPVR